MKTGQDRCIDVIGIQRILVAIGLEYSLIYGDGSLECDPEQTITIELHNTPSIVAEAIGSILRYMNDGDVSVGVVAPDAILN